jgi:hypothetical protein
MTVPSGSLIRHTRCRPSPLRYSGQRTANLVTRPAKSFKISAPAHTPTHAADSFAPASTAIVPPTAAVAAARYTSTETITAAAQPQSP